MKITALRATVSFAAVTLGMLAATSAAAQSRQIRTPNITTADGPTTVTLGDTTFTNKGIVGAGRLDANTRDFRGETLGSFSGMAINLKTWRRNADGSYSSDIFTLPDRGPFDGGIDYRDRVHAESIRFSPLTGTAALPLLPSSQNQLIITPTGGFTLRDALGNEFTGRDPGASTVTRGGVVYPLATAGTANGLISLDPEAIAFLPNGNFYVSDEYAAGIYYFDATGRQIGVIQTVNALLPRNAAGTIDFNSVTPGVVGRRNNQGLEALALTPDNKKLVTILQSATVQDTNGANQQTRNNTRILIYDISSNATPTNPIGHFVLQLPVFNNNGSGGAPDRTAAQSEVLALNDNQFLVLARDGLGRGVAAGASTSPTPVFKSVLLVDTTGATNLAGTNFETTTTPIATNGTLLSSIVPVQQVELVNLLNPTQLARVGLSLTRLPLTNLISLGEKIEAMALAPVLEEGAPQDFFLFVGNDNDFQATNASFNGAPATLGALDGTGNNDNVMLVYRLTLPTYVDPQALQALNLLTPDVLYGSRMAMTGLGKSTTLPAMRFLNSERGWDAAPDGRRGKLWLDTDRSKIGAGASPLTGLDVNTTSLTLGLDIPIGEIIRVGVTGGYRNLDGGLAFGAPIQAEAWTAGGYAAIELPNGLYAQASGAWLGDAQFAQLGRLSVYGQQAIGRTSGDGWATSGEVGWRLPVGRFSVMPFAAVDYVDLQLDGYAERGASVSNVTYADRSFSQVTASFGGEVGIQLGAIRPAIRGGYSIENEAGDRTAAVRLTNARHAMGGTVLTLVDTERNSGFAEARIAMRQGPLSGYVAGRGRWGRGDDDARVSIGVGYAF